MRGPASLRRWRWHGFHAGEAAGRLQAVSALEHKTSPLTVKATGLPPRPHWAEPRLIAEVRFSEYTRDRHVRHPSFLGMREDKNARKVILDPRAGTALRMRS